MSPTETHCEEIHRVTDERSGLHAWIALHSTALGPAFGGLRIASYDSDHAALADACGLAEAMTWKCALAGFPGGGGKGVVAAERLLDRPRALAVLGDFIEQLNGRFRTAGDIGATEDDLRRIRARTRFMADLDALGDLGDAVAIGLVATMRALLGTSGGREVRGLRVCIQGLGTVGLALARRLLGAGAHVVAAEVDAQRRSLAAALGPIEWVDPADAFDVEADVFAPCARGGVIDPAVAQRLRARAVIGGANRVLSEPAAGEILRERGITYAPDFVVNAGAVIRGAWLSLSGTPGTDEEIEAIGARMLAIVDEAKRRAVTPESVALERAQARVAAATKMV